MVLDDPMIDSLSKEKTHQSSCNSHTFSPEDEDEDVYTSQAINNSPFAALACIEEGGIINDSPPSTAPPQSEKAKKKSSKTRTLDATTLPSSSSSSSASNRVSGISATKHIESNSVPQRYQTARTLAQAWPLQPPPPPPKVKPQLTKKVASPEAASTIKAGATSAMGLQSSRPQSHMLSVAGPKALSMQVKPVPAIESSSNASAGQEENPPSQSPLCKPHQSQLLPIAPAWTGTTSHLPTNFIPKVDDNIIVNQCQLPSDEIQNRDPPLSTTNAVESSKSHWMRTAAAAAAAWQMQPVLETPSRQSFILPEALIDAVEYTSVPQRIERIGGDYQGAYDADWDVLQEEISMHSDSGNCMQHNNYIEQGLAAVFRQQQVLHSGLNSTGSEGQQPVEPPPRWPQSPQNVPSLITADSILYGALTGMKSDHGGVR